MSAPTGQLAWPLWRGMACNAWPWAGTWWGQAAVCDRIDERRENAAFCKRLDFKPAAGAFDAVFARAEPVRAK